LLALGALGLVALPVHQDRRARFFQLAALLGVIVLIAIGVLHERHPFWPLALAIPLLGTVPLPGAPRSGIAAYLVFAVFSVAATHVIFFGEDRYHMVLTPVLCLLAACALRHPDERAATVDA
jgi:hypothetical protein